MLLLLVHGSGGIEEFLLVIFLRIKLKVYLIENMINKLDKAKTTYK